MRGDRIIHLIAAAAIAQLMSGCTGEPRPFRPPPCTQIDPAGIERTHEFQLRIDPAVFADRDSAVDAYMQELVRISGVSTPESSRFTSIRTQQSFKLYACGIRHLQLRAREYLSGRYEGRWRLDAKCNHRQDEEGARLEGLSAVAPDAPGKHPTGPVVHELERDVHACEGDSKWSRSGRIWLEAPPGLALCRDVAAYFPCAFEAMELRAHDRKLPLSGSSYWWVYEQYGQLPGGAEIKADVTIRYDSLDDAVAGRNPRFGEWSMDAATPADLPDEASDRLFDIYDAMLDRLGSHEELPCDGD